MSPAIRVTALELSRGNQRILKGIDLSVPRGLFFIIIGPNGSGKTTLMKAMAGLEVSQGGRIEIMDTALADYGRKALARKIALVPQSMPSDFSFTVEEMVLCGRAPHLGLLGVEGREDLAVAREAMAFTGVDHLADRRVDRLSGGEQQRVSIARAICQQPEVILLDEPTSALDLSHQVMIMDLMERLKRERGTTVVMVSHDINLAAIYGDTLALVKDGRMAAEGPPTEVLRPEILEPVYGCSVLVDQGPFGGLPRISPVPGRFGGSPPR